MLLLLLASVLIGIWLATPAVASSPTIISTPEDYTSGEVIIKDNAIIRPANVEAPKLLKAKTGRDSGRHNIRSEKQVLPGQLADWLSNHRSPLSPYAASIAASPYSTTIIGICVIEQSNCAKLPGGKNWNLWGIGGASGLKYYSTPEEAIEAISTLLAKYEAQGRDTIEELNCYYVQPCSQNWLNTVLKIKASLEAL